MELALIPPISWLHYDDATRYHLVLPHLLRDETYAAHYWDQPGYHILDNGEAEGENNFTPEALHIIANSYGFDCVVVPDTMGSMIGTAEKLKDYSYHWRDEDGGAIPHRMVVVQARSYQEVDALVGDASRYEWVTHLGIPRILAASTGMAAEARVNVANHIIKEWGDRFKLHFLGMHPAHLMEWQLIQETFYNEDIVQGMDTSLPFNAAYEKRCLDDGLPQPIVRPDNYFHLPKESFDKACLDHNVDLMLTGLE